MKKEWEETKIADKTYRFEMLPADLGLPLSIDIIAAFGPIMGSIMPLFEVSGEDGIENLDGDLLQKVLQEATRNVDREKIMPIVKALIPICFVIDSTTPNGRRCSLNDFDGNVFEMFKVAFFAARYNFSDFFDGSPLNFIKSQGAQHA